MTQKKVWTEAREADDVLIIGFPGEGHLDEADAGDVHTEMISAIESRDAKKVVIDFANVSYISSAFLGTLVALNRAVRAKEGALRLAGMRPEIYQLLQATNLHRFFTFSDNVHKALASF